MAKTKSTYEFSGKVEFADIGYMTHAIFIPPQILKQLPQQRLRTKGTINGFPFSLAIQYRKSGDSFFMIGAAMRKATGLDTGHKVNVSFRIVSDDTVDLPEELEAVLSQDDDAMKAWKKLTPGMQRSCCFYVTSVKNVDSRIKKALEIVEKIKQGIVPFKRSRL